MGVLAGWYVLVVDDEFDSREVARMMLETVGAHVALAADGQEALAQIDRQQPQIILSDLSMPEADGWQMIDALTHDAATPDIPVIALTAHAMEGDREDVLAAGFAGYIPKPVNPDTFISQLMAVLRPLPTFQAKLGA